MTHRSGDRTKQPAGCQPERFSSNPCPNLKETNLTDMNGETYRCEVCGEYVYLDYEEMK